MSVSQATNREFATAFQSLRLQAKAYGVDPNTESMRRYLRHVAEVMAQDRAMLRECQNRQHKIR